MLLDSDKIRVQHMIEAAEQALAYASQRSQLDAESDPPLQHLLIRNLEILGEAASRASQSLRDDHPEIPWRDMIDMRNRLIHAYFDVDMGIIWTTVVEALPSVVRQLHSIIDAS